MAELASRAEDNPLDERVAGQYLQALYRAGRAADALEHYRGLRARLVEELGTDPGEPLRELHHRILSGDPALVVTVRPGAQPTGPVPRQLPPAPAGFTGRAAEQAELTTALGGADGDIVAVTAVTGAGGIGKTWLALHWAHRHADRFPDGQLFVDLQGFSPNASPMDPSTALRGFLGALGVDPRAVPPDVHAQSALFRSLVAGRRVLVVVDNARSSDQVAPLLPGSPTCAIVVTSRDRPAELPARHGARPVRLDALSADEARSVLTHRVGAARIDAEPEAVRELLSWCGGYPLALAIVAGRATAYPEFPLSALAGELRDEATRLDVLDDDNVGMSLPTVLSWSHRALSAQQARALALLGLAPGPDVGLPVAANLLDLPVPTTRQVLRTLEDLHLVVQHAPARWSMHDLVKLYAAGIAEQDTDDTGQDAALCRLVDFYLHTAHLADRLLEPHRSPIHLDPPTPGCRPHRIADGSSALAWFSAEHPNLLAAQQLAAERGHDTQAWQLAWALDDFHHRGGRLHDAVAVWRIGLRAVERTGDRAALVLAHRLLGGTATYTGLHEEAMTHLSRSLELAEEAGDRLARAHTHRVLAQTRPTRWTASGSSPTTAADPPTRSTTTGGRWTCNAAGSTASKRPTPWTGWPGRTWHWARCAGRARCGGRP
ncbi:hypothetical protein FHS29_003896 [Saccharothrix tamanrassetensis]|uniref:Bacterial transcriptional activator domain-containing protein n=1 Tax=Saccharothrix tamanrassetensis TaxID=1051531 RepID=A0A841CK14_9PSEU|nr:hypothetical protein [Saccharothrix tamanrassetensis]